MIDNTELEWPFTVQDCSVCGPVEEETCIHLTERIEFDHPNLSCIFDPNIHHAAVQNRLLCLDEDQGCINRSILPSGMGARGVSSEHVENMEMFSCSPT